jgi:hypothetical protein
MNGWMSKGGGTECFRGRGKREVVIEVWLIL